MFCNRCGRTLKGSYALDLENNSRYCISCPERPKPKRKKSFWNSSFKVIGNLMSRLTNKKHKEIADEVRRN